MSEVPSAPSRTFTLREMFILITVLCLLLGFLTMMLNARREAQGSSQYGTCFNNMSQLSRGMQNHVEVWRGLPPLYWSREPKYFSKSPLSPLDAAGMYSWQVRMLPFLEESTLYKSIAASTGKFASDATKAQVPSPRSNARISPSQYRVDAFRCPAVPEDQPDGNCNYVALSATRLPLLLNVGMGADGLPAYTQEPDGMIIADRAMRGQPLARMTDGASKTALIIESREPTRSNWYDPQQSFVVGFLPADSRPVDSAKTDYFPRFGQTGWEFNSARGNRTAVNYGPKSTSSKVLYNGPPGDPLERSWGPSSAHIDGRIIVGMGDGSVKAITPDIDPAVFFSAITARGAENVPGLP